jgi:hypothetical protein
VKRASFVKTVSEKAVVLKHQVELVREVALRRKEALRKSETARGHSLEENRRPSARREVGLGRRARSKEIRVLAPRPRTFFVNE